MDDRRAGETAPGDRRDGFQNPLVHEGAEPDDAPDTNEGADERATIRDPEDPEPGSAAR